MNTDAPTNLTHPETGGPMSRQEFILYDGNHSLRFDEFVVRFAQRIKDGEFQTRARWLGAFKVLAERVASKRRWDALAENLFAKYGLGERLRAPSPAGLPPEMLAVLEANELATFKANRKQLKKLKRKK